MRTTELGSWQALECEVAKLNRHLASRKDEESGYISRPIFRGQGRSAWSLQTSLERYLGVGVSVADYNRYLLRIKPAVETYTGRKWKVKRDISTSKFPFATVPNYRFMLYTRHHGFPSPLLDWTESPYVALFFAYRDAVVDDDVAIYVFVESLGRGRGGFVASPNIFVQGPYVSSHPRHFIQQCEYTVATQKVDDKWIYCAHDAYFEEAKDEEQDLLIKFKLPGRHRTEYLQRLQQMNINAYTLFATEEGLMEMLAFREMVEREL